MLFPERLSRTNLGQWAPFVGHELFHVWNGQAITCQGQEYWFSEGFTDYYCQVLAVRLGHISEEGFLHNMKEACTKYLSKQGVLSLHQAGEDKSANFSLVYEGGKLVAAVLDLQIRQLTNNQMCLDDLMRRMYQRFGSTDQGYTQDDILAILQDLTGRDYRDFLADYINGTTRLPLEEAFTQAGLNLEVAVEEELPSLDFVVHKMLRINSLSYDQMLIKRSAEAGYRDGDCLLAIDEKHTKSARDLQHMAQRSQPGQSVQLTLKRGDQTLTQSLLLGGQGHEIPMERKVSARLTKMEVSTEKQERILAGILGQ
jgi:predicted metalloprotease with PDZ domain